jgi:UDP-GlcNAc:undecaprenyl-phosphate GlcNAc-1-phosphate transferase
MEGIMSSVLFFILIALFATIFLHLILPRFAHSVGLVDNPNIRKSHQGRVPLIGGIAMYTGFIIAFLSLDISWSYKFTFLLSSGVVLLTGMIDDIHELSAKQRFIAQGIAAIIMALGAGHVLHNLGAIGLGGEIVSLGMLAIPFTIFATIGVINALNMSDGIDGLAGGLSIVSLIGFAIAAWLSGMHDHLQVLLLLISVILAFLLFNFRFPGRSHALVFMGDAGSTFLGFALAWFAISLSQGEHRAIAPVTALWLVALPLFDTVAIMLRRIINRKSPFSADKEHLHHALILAGIGVAPSALIILTLSTLGVAFGLYGYKYGLSELIMFYLFVGGFVFYFFAMKRVWGTLHLMWLRIERRGVRDRRMSERRVKIASKSGWAMSERRSGYDRRNFSDRRHRAR